MDNKSALVYMMREQTTIQATDAAAFCRIRPQKYTPISLYQRYIILFLRHESEQNGLVFVVYI